MTNLSNPGNPRFRKPSLKGDRTVYARTIRQKPGAEPVTEVGMRHERRAHPSSPVLAPQQAVPQLVRQPLDAAVLGVLQGGEEAFQVLGAVLHDEQENGLIFQEVCFFGVHPSAERGRRHAKRLGCPTRCKRRLEPVPIAIRSRGCTSGETPPLLPWGQLLCVFLK